MVVERRKSGWVSYMEQESVRALLIKLDDEPPPDDFTDALNSCCNAFYPSLAGVAKPWDEHRKGPRRKQLLRRKATTAWPLDWYWKVLVTSMPSWLDSDDDGDLGITIAQVRHWMLVTVSGLSIESSKDSRKPVRVERLRRPPMFGQSDRLHSWDQYWIYLLGKDAICRAWQRVRGNHLEEPYVLGRHEVRYDFSKEAFTGDAKSFSVSVHAKLTLDTHLENSEFVAGGKTSTPFDRVSSPVFPKPSIKGESKRLYFLMASEPVCRAFESLSHVWNDPTIQTIHINAPPGSGKEVLSDSLYWFKDTDGAKCSWAPSGSSSSLASLFGFGSAPSRNEGLVQKARGGWLILDEIDKADREVRDALLRLLESNEYIRPDSGEVVGIDRRDRPGYVLLSSKPYETVLQEPPPDLWTRIQVQISVAHPLDVAPEDELRRVLSQYFLFFWNLHIGQFFQLNPIAVSRKMNGGRNASRTVVVRKYWNEVARLFGASDFPTVVADVFSRVCAGRFKRMSVRNIRSIAQRCVYAFFQEIVYNSTSRDDRAERIPLGRKSYKPLALNAEFELDIRRIVESSIGGRVDYPG